jgi:Ni/Fe-hydrogenase 1 B-type cytochrome subunit
MKLETIRHPLAQRILHEVILTSILLLVLTGFYIHRPFIGGAGFLMSMSRGVHFFAAALLIIGVVIRIALLFFGHNRDWRSFIPTFSDIKLLPGAILYYGYIGKEPEFRKKYNPLQMISYSLVFVLVIFQILSGFALISPDAAWISWLNYGLFNNEIVTRLAHYIITWLFVLFMMIHVYLTIRENFSQIMDMHSPSSKKQQIEEPVRE